MARETMFKNTPVHVTSNINMYEHPATSCKDFIASHARLDPYASSMTQTNTKPGEVDVRAG
jgi:hypothetical protein